MYGSNEGESPKQKLRSWLKMAITTKKVFKGFVQEHVMNIMLDEAEIESGYDIQTTEENLVTTQLQIVIDEFKNWYSPYEQKQTPNRYEAFKSWILGLPSCFSVQYEYYPIHQTMKGWFENCGETYKGEPGSKESDLYYYLTTREFEVLCKKHGVPGITSI
jgi:hypothetical protein